MQRNRRSLSRPGWARLRREGDGPWRVLATVLAVLVTLVAIVAVLAIRSRGPGRPW